MDERFSEEACQPEVVRPDELQELLKRLHDRDLFGPEEPQADLTIDSVVEVTGMSTDEVLATLEEMRNERYAKVLAELEEPLYRVERPSPQNSDPLHQNPPFARVQRHRSILDSLRRPEVVIVHKKARSDEELELESRSLKQGSSTLLLLFLAMLAAIILPLISRWFGG